MFRRFKKTVPWLRENHWSKKKDVRIYEFVRLQSLLGFTAPNVFATYYGTMITFDKDQNPIQPNKRSYDLMRYFQDAGYITGFVNDFCQTTVFFNAATQFYDKDRKFDHYYINHACDENMA